MAYQLGVTGLLQFHTTLARLESGDYSGAADSALKVIYGHRQTYRPEPQRAAESVQGRRSLGSPGQ